MKPIAIFYHTCINVHQAHAINIIQEQTDSMKQTGLLDAASKFYVGINGDLADMAAVDSLLPAKAMVFQNAPDTWASCEVPTLNTMRVWVDNNPDHHVLYLHMKGLGHPPGSMGYEPNRIWRLQMENVVIWRWGICVRELDSGAEAVGHRWYNSPTGNYFAGNFWWMRSPFIKTLPEIKPQGHLAGGRYEAEVWIGRGPRQPRIVNL